VNHKTFVIVYMSLSISLFLLKNMLNSSLETALGNKKIYCFVNSNFYEPHRNRKCDRKTLRDLTQGNTRFSMTLMRGECNLINANL